MVGFASKKYLVEKALLNRKKTEERGWSMRMERQTVAQRKAEIREILQNCDYNFSSNDMAVLVEEHRELSLFERELNEEFGVSSLSSEMVGLLIQNTFSTLFLVDHKNRIKFAGGFSINNQKEFIDKDLSVVVKQMDYFIESSTRARNFKISVKCENLESIDGETRHGKIIPLKKNWLLCFTMPYNNEKQCYSESVKDADRDTTVLDRVRVLEAERRKDGKIETYSPDGKERGEQLHGEGRDKIKSSLSQ